jgi:hypothetical protein
MNSQNFSQGEVVRREDEEIEATIIDR